MTNLFIAINITPSSSFITKSAD